MSLCLFSLLYIHWCEKYGCVLKCVCIIYIKNGKCNKTMERSMIKGIPWCTSESNALWYNGGTVWKHANSAIITIVWDIIIKILIIIACTFYVIFIKKRQCRLFFNGIHKCTKYKQIVVHCCILFICLFFMVFLVSVNDCNDDIKQWICSQFAMLNNQHSSRSIPWVLTFILYGTWVIIFIQKVTPNSLSCYVSEW